jgi:glutaredoxin
MSFEKVNGNHRKHHVQMFTLSTCGWCRKTKLLLKELDVAYEYVDVDLLSDEEVDVVRVEQRKHNPRGSFPTMVIDGGKHVIIGYKEEQIREALK